MLNTFVIQRFRFSFSSVSSQNLKQTKAKRVGLKAGCLLQLHLHSMAPARGRVRTNREMRTDDAVQMLDDCERHRIYVTDMFYICPKLVRHPSVSIAVHRLVQQHHAAAATSDTPRIPFSITCSSSNSSCGYNYDFNCFSLFIVCVRFKQIESHASRRRGTAQRNRSHRHG